MTHKGLKTRVIINNIVIFNFFVLVEEGRGTFLVENGHAHILINSVGAMGIV